MLDDFTGRLNTMMYGLDFKRFIKFATLLVSCIGDTQNGCEDDEIQISCNNNGNLKITSAWYGRTDNTICPHSTINQSTPNCSQDETSRVKDLCKDNVDKDKCTLNVNNEVFSPDPCKNIFKHLTVVFQCDYETTTPVDCTTTQQHTSADLFTTTTTIVPSSEEPPTTTGLIITDFVPSSEEPPTTTGMTLISNSQTTNPSCMCPCRFVTTSNATPSSPIIKDVLKVNKGQLSSFIRKKISVYEDRPTAKGIGFVAISFLIFVASLVIVPDAINLIQFLRMSVKAKSR
ncbi:uncharacterized protein LOC125657529 [Ostrea edulis]|uniref:uncharacterized protein LOC125657529 n=1 Tax=Ostrea edulis TaxID=37623 RepID=UPI0024AF878B|nr:uncharacterized protein LOC125657529 [Ostrea edulis]